MRKYQIMSFEQNGWNPDGSGIVIADCGHNHRTLSGAYKCLCDLQKNNAAKWYHAVINHVDGSALTDDEIMDLQQIEHKLN